MTQGERGSDIAWNLPEVPYNGKEYLQAINSNTDTIAVCEEGRILHYLAKEDTLLLKGQQSPRAYRIYSQERPYMRYPFQYGDSISGNYKGYCRDENEYFTLEGFGYTIADGAGYLTDGEDTLKYVTRLHFSDDYVNNYSDGTAERMKEDRYMWYCAGSRYAVMESVKTSRYENDDMVPIDSISYLYLPYMQLDLAEDAANDQLIAELVSTDAAKGLDASVISTIDAMLSPDGRIVTVNYQLSSDSDISI
ncbi:MAG: hypothetical protein HUJ97_08555, partial [Bacteroidales bacterium]|nr:hypothetical protein [Bacteroidales bacterium]